MSPTHTTVVTPLDEPGWRWANAPWPPGVRAGCSERVGGVSVAPWDSFNLGDHVGDDPAAVVQNRALLAQHLGGRPVFCRQVHGTAVLQLHTNSAHGQIADASWTDEPGLVCAMMVADCLPVLLASADGRSVAAAHAGWRGLAGVDDVDGQGVLEALSVHWPAAQSRADRAHIQVWLGPCIGPTAFEVGQEVREAFVRQDPAAAVAFQALTGSGQGKYLADLVALARQRLARLGFTQVAGNDSSPAWCTVGQPSRFFSHRRDAARLGSTGRLAAGIWRV